MALAKKITRGSEIKLTFDIDETIINASSEIELVIQEENSDTQAFRKTFSDTEIVKVDDDTFEYILVEADTISLEDDRNYLIQARVTVASGAKYPINFTPNFFYLSKLLDFSVPA